MKRGDVKMRRIIGLWLIWLLILTGTAFGIELVRQKGQNTTVLFPITDSSGTAQPGCTCTVTYTSWNDNGVPGDFAALGSGCTHIHDEVAAESGWYYISLTGATHLASDYTAIRIVTSVCTAVNQRILIRTMVGDPLNIASTNNGGPINVTTGKIDEVTTVGSVTTKTGYNVTSGTVDTATTCGNMLTAANVWDLNISAYSGAGYAGTYLKFLKDNTTGDAYSLLNTAVAEPAQGACSTANISPINKIGCLDKFRRNKIRQSSTLTELYNFAGTVVDEKSTVSDDDTYFLRGVFVTGP